MLGNPSASGAGDGIRTHAMVAWEATALPLGDTRMMTPFSKKYATYIAFLNMCQWNTNCGKINLLIIVFRQSIVHN